MMRILLTKNGVPSKKWIWNSKGFYDQKLGLAEMADCTSRSPAAQWWVWSPKTALNKHNKPKMGGFPMISYDFSSFFLHEIFHFPDFPDFPRLRRCQEGDIITAGQCRPLAKTVRFNVIKAGTWSVYGASNARGIKIYPLVNVYIAMERSTIF